MSLLLNVWTRANAGNTRDDLDDYDVTEHNDVIEETLTSSNRDDDVIKKTI